MNRIRRDPTYRIVIDLEDTATGERQCYGLVFRESTIEQLAHTLAGWALDPDNPLTHDRAWFLIRLATAAVDGDRRAMDELCRGK